MKILFMLTAVYTAVETNTEVLQYNRIDICNEHIQKCFPGDKYEFFNKFKQTISDDNCVLENYHIDVCKILFGTPLSCLKCHISLSSRRILCKKCSSSKFFHPFCRNCSSLTSMFKKLEIYKLCLRKFILKKYSQETVKYYLETLKADFVPSTMLFTLSGISFNSEEIKILSDVLLEGIDKSIDFSIKSERIILDVFNKYHSKYENEDSMELFSNFLKNNVRQSSEYILYLSARLDFKFYDKITSKDLFNLFSAIFSNVFELNNQKDKLAIFDVIKKANSIGLRMEKEDFYRLIDLFIENTQHLLYFYKLFESDEYFNMLTGEKIISMFMKMFKLKSIRSACSIKDLRIFGDATDTQQEEETNSNDIFDRNSLYNQFIDIFDKSLICCTEVYSAYRSLVKRIFISFSGFTPNGRVKLACILFSFLDPKIDHQIIFRDLLEMFYYSKQGFDKFTVENVLDIMDLYLKHNISYDYIKPTIVHIFANIKSGDELDRIFDYVFNSPNAIKMLGIFAQLHGVRNLSDSKMDQLILYLIKNFQEVTLKILTKLNKKDLLGANIQKEVILKMTSCLNIKNFEFFEYGNKKIFNNFSRSELNLTLEFCLKHKNYEFIAKFVEYLDFNQLKQIKEDDLENINKIVIDSLKNSKKDIFKYLSTPFFYFCFPSIAISLIDSFEDTEHDNFYINTIFKSILNDPFLQKSFDYFETKRSDSDMFENKYMKKIVNQITDLFATNSDICLVFYENLNSEMKFLFKAILIKDIIERDNKKIEIKDVESLDDLNIYIENIPKECTAFSQDSNYEKVNFFIKNFDPFLYYFAPQVSYESFKRVVLDLDLKSLIEAY